MATEKVDERQEDRVTTDDLSEIKEEGEDESPVKETKQRVWFFSSAFTVIVVGPVKR